MDGAPRQLAGYRLLERVAVGGMAEIFRAVRTGPGEFQKAVAVKLVLPHLGRDPQFVKMFLQEARLGARLSSPNLVQVFDFGEENGTHYLVMEYVEGIDLGGLLAFQRPLPPGLALYVGQELCAALADLHAATDEQGKPLNIVHRDVNPGNLLVSTSGDVKLGDFGIAKAQALSLRTERGTIKGKLAYLSPEQVRGEEVDGRADLYAAALVLFEALTGERYLVAEGEAALLRAAACPRFRPPSSLQPGLPPWLDEVLARALAPEAALRYADAAQLGQALRSGEALRERVDLRRELGALVQRARGELSSHRPPPPPAGAGDRPSPATAGAVGPATELMPAPLRQTSRRAALRVAALIVLAAAAAVAVVRATRSFHPPHRGARPRAAALDARAVGLARSVTLDAAPTPSAVDVAPAGARVPLRARRARRGPLAPHLDAGVGSTALLADQGAALEQTRRQALAQLGEVDRLLREKGILPADAPRLLAERHALGRAVAAGRFDEAAIASLVQRARSLVVDRALLDAKLARITAQLASARLEEAVAVQLKQRAARALSYAVTGRYTEANRELNAIHRRLESR